jgi:hypothetical protein
MDIQAIADALGLKRAGSEYKGPCPLCGGHDRFHIKAGSQHDLILLCRHGCRYGDIMRELENRQLVPKGDFKPTLYRQKDLSYCDALIMVAEGNINTDMKFKAADMLALSRMISKVDQPRQDKLQSLMDKMRGRLR